VKTTQQQRDDIRAKLWWLKDILDDLDEMRECLRIVERRTAWDDTNRALHARIAAALSEPEPT
jgi:hypothetical protein